MKTYKFIKTSTAGNRTGFILSQNAYKNQRLVMQTIASKKNLEAEQFAYLWKQGNDCIMKTAGGELCGGAILASPTILGKSTRTVKLVNCNRQYQLDISKLDAKKLLVRTALPNQIFLSKQKIQVIFADKAIGGYRVSLDGISYFVTKEEIPLKLTQKKFKNLDKQLRTQNSPCLGIIQIKTANYINPTVWVKKVNTVTKEQGCTTGTIAAQVCFPQSNGLWQQPSGEFIKAKPTSSNIEIESSVEILGDGNLYLQN